METWGLSLTVLGILIAVGIGVLALTPVDFAIARGCTWASAALLAGTFFMWQLRDQPTILARIIVGTVIGVTIFVGIPEALRWIRSREPAASMQSTNALVSPQAHTRINSSPVTSPRYTGALLQKRMEIYSALLEALNTSSRSAFDLGGKLSDAWETDIVTQGPAHFVSQLKNFRTKTSDSFIEMGKIIARYDYFSDISRMMGDRFRIQGPIFEATNQFIEAVEALPDHPSAKMVGLIKERRDTFALAMRDFGKWIDETKDAITANAQEESAERSH